MVSVKRQRMLYVVGDLLATSLAWFTFNIIRYFNVAQEYGGYRNLERYLSEDPVWLGQIFFPVMMMALYYISGYYNRVFFRSRVEELTMTATTAFIGTIIIYFVAIVDDPIPDRISNYELIIILLLLLFTMVYATRLTITIITRRKISHGQLRFNSLIVGTSSSARILYQKLKGLNGPRAAAYNVVGFVATDTNIDVPDINLPVYTLDELPEIVKSERIKNLIVDTQPEGMQHTLSIINRLLPLDLPVLISPSLMHVITSKPKISDVNGEILIDIAHANMSDSTVNLKRLGDIIVSFIALILLSPVFAAIAIAIKCNSPGPIFYSQERIGLRKKPFTIYKFRSMTSDAEDSGPALSSSNDSRITSVGRILRKYRIDEFPQFWNVLKGDMSLVGPRPEREFYIRQIIKKAPYYTLIHQVRPGITSLGMVKHGYASNVDQMIERLQYDLIYLENVSLTVDLKILMYTVSTVINGRGV